MFRQVKRWLRASNADPETEPATLAGLNASELQLTEVTTDADDRARLHEMEYSEPGNSSYSLEFNNLTYSVKPKKRGSKRLVILDKVSGHCASGRVLAVHTLFFPSCSRIYVQMLDSLVKLICSIPFASVICEHEH